MVIKLKGKEYYLVPDLERILPLSITTIRLYLRDGRIKGRKIGCLWYVSNLDLEAFLEVGSRRVKEFTKSKVET